MTLTQTAILTKRVILAFIIMITLLTLSKVGLDIWERYRIAALPPPVEKAEMRFGPLPKIKFPGGKVTSSNYSYSLDTTTGGFPDFPKIMKIYFVPQGSLSLLSSEKGQKQAESLGFSLGPEVLDDSTYRFSDEKGGTLTTHITSGNFEFRRPINPANTPDNPSFPEENKLIETFRNYLAQKGLLPAGLSQGRGNVILNDLEKEASKTAEISLWPDNQDGMKIVTGDETRGPIKGIFAPHDKEVDKFISVIYNFWPPDKTSFSTYPLKTAEQAFADLKKGLGHISLESPKSAVSITSVYLAYYQEDLYSPFLQPVFVFEGPSFVGLVSAIESQ